jgi:hypothetical protein
MSGEIQIETDYRKERVRDRANNVEIQTEILKQEIR